MAERGLPERELDRVAASLDRSLPLLATMMMHCQAMRLGLGIATREAVTG